MDVRTAPDRTEAGVISPAFLILARSSERHLRVANKASMTLKTYLSAIEALGTYLAVQDMPTGPGAITRGHVAAFLADTSYHGRSRRRP